MLFSIIILMLVVVAIWRMEKLSERINHVDETNTLFIKKIEYDFEKLKAFVDKHVKNGGIEEYKRLTQESIDRQLQEAAIKPMRPDTTYELVVSTIEAPQVKKVANKRRKKKK